MDRKSDLDVDAVGIFDTRYKAFLETVGQLRPRLHRYCARMTGSVMDGEDIMQEALFEAYRKLDRFDDNRRLDRWLLRIAHNRCIDFLRTKQVRHKAEALAAEPDIVQPVEPAGREIERALERLVINLPPMERACVLLKDVFDYSLEEIAGLVDSTAGGVKSALNRGRSKLAGADDPPQVQRAPDPELTKLLRLYVELFNRREWTELREALSADARLRITNFFAGRLSDSYFFTYFERMRTPWQFVMGMVEGEPIAMELHQVEGVWVAHAATRLDMDGGKIVRMRHYVECPWLFSAADGWSFEAPSQA
jgi:RNA polymerase sigma-70 factor, ECF subfamily